MRRPRSHDAGDSLAMDGEFQYFFGSKRLQLGQFDSPDSEQICISQDGLVYVSDRSNNRVQVFQQNGRCVREFRDYALNGPTGLALTKDGHIIVVSSQNSLKRSIFFTSGECVHEVKDVGLESPYGVAIDDNGFIFVADCDNSRIAKL